MKKIGLVGGVGWPATLSYYQGLCVAAHRHFQGGSPRISIESLDMRETTAHRGTSDDPASWAGFDNIFRDALTNLESTGCEVAAIASVTPHARFAQVTADMSLRVVSVVDATARAVLEHGQETVVVLGTPMTMSGTWFVDALRMAGINSLGEVSQDEIDEVARLLETYFYPGNGFDGRGALLAFCHRLIASTPRTAIILACTDFSAAFPEHAPDTVFEVEGLIFLDAATAHIQAILAAAMESD